MSSLPRVCLPAVQERVHVHVRYAPKAQGLLQVPLQGHLQGRIRLAVAHLRAGRTNVAVHVRVNGKYRHGVGQHVDKLTQVGAAAVRQNAVQVRYWTLAGSAFSRLRSWALAVQHRLCGSWVVCRWADGAGGYMTLCAVCGPLHLAERIPTHRQQELRVSLVEACQ